MKNTDWGSVNYYFYYFHYFYYFPSCSPGWTSPPDDYFHHFYYCYDFQHYEEVLARSEKAIKQFEDLPIIPKFELLKAYALKQTKGIEAFKEAIDFVALSYPNTDEGKHALELQADIKGIASDKETKIDATKSL